MYKLIACDLDGTLLDDQNNLPENNIVAIRKLTARGIRFVIATGRGFKFVERILTSVGLQQKENEYSISFNGAVVTENKDNQIIYFAGFTFAEARALFEFGKKIDICTFICTTDDIYYYNIDPIEQKHYTDQNVTIKEILPDDDISFLQNAMITKVMFQNPDMEYLHKVAKELNDSFGATISTSFSSNRYIEINKSGVDKGIALSWLADSLKIPLAEIMTVGDSHNDLTMFQRSGYTVSPANAVNEIKEISDYNSPYDNNDGILEDILNKFY